MASPSAGILGIDDIDSALSVGGILTIIAVAWYANHKFKLVGIHTTQEGTVAVAQTRGRAKERRTWLFHEPWHWQQWRRPWSIIPRGDPVLVVKYPGWSIEVNNKDKYIPVPLTKQPVVLPTRDLTTPMHLGGVTFTIEAQFSFRSLYTLENGNLDALRAMVWGVYDPDRCDSRHVELVRELTGKFWTTIREHIETAAADGQGLPQLDERTIITAVNAKIVSYGCEIVSVDWTIAFSGAQVKANATAQLAAAIDQSSIPGPRLAPVVSSLGNVS